MTQPRRVFRKIAKVFLYGIAVIAVILVVAHFAWKYSGSNQWKLVQEKKGVKVYALKAPGSTLQQFKAITRVKTSLNRVASTFTDTTTAGCRQFAPGCESGTIFKPWDDQTLNYVQAYRIVLPRPFSPIDMVIKTQMSRDPKTKALLMEMTSVPEKVPHDDCCLRMTHMRNRWRFTPAGNGEFDVEFIQDDDPRIPYWLYNRVIPIGLTGLGRTLERVTNKDKYGHREFAFLADH